MYNLVLYQTSNSQHTPEIAKKVEDWSIHRRWDNGYHITSTAATWDQATFVLSFLRRKLADETQETLYTPSFPSTHHVKEKWSRNLYIAYICYERIVSWTNKFWDFSWLLASKCLPLASLEFGHPLWLVQWIKTFNSMLNLFFVDAITYILNFAVKLLNQSINCYFGKGIIL